MTLNRHWGWHKMDNDWKPTETLIRNMIDIASKGGNFLLNVGPTGQGLIPEPSVERLRELGDWMRVNGPAIYGTSAGPLPKLAWGRCTKKSFPGGTILYLHVFDWPADGKLPVPGIKEQVQSANLLATGQKLQTQSTATGLVITVPPTAPGKFSSTITLQIRAP